MNNNKKQSLVDKYRPTNINNIIGHKKITHILNTFIKNKCFKHLLLYGPPGVGKTSTILACARKLYGPEFENMYIELNGSDERGIDVIRENVKNYVSKKQLAITLMDSKNVKQTTSMKLVILDECDNMTENAQYALKSVIHNNTATTRFCLICNYETKIIEDLKSICIPLLFSPLTASQHIPYLTDIAKNENINIDINGINAIINISKGDMRSSINILQQLQTTIYNNDNIDDKNNLISEDKIYDLLGKLKTNIKNEMLKYIFDNTISLHESIKKVTQIKIEYNIEPIYILNEVVEYINSSIHTFNNTNLIKLYVSLGKIQQFQTSSYNEDIFIANIISTVRLCK